MVSLSHSSGTFCSVVCSPEFPLNLKGSHVQHNDVRLSLFAEHKDFGPTFTPFPCFPLALSFQHDLGVSRVELRQNASQVDPRDGFEGKQPIPTL